MADKTGWTYIEIPTDIAQKLKPGTKKSFRVKGKLDSYKISQTALIPMGGGTFILPLNLGMRKEIGKREGAMLTVELEEDKLPIKFDNDMVACIQDEPEAFTFFKTLTPSHQKYFSQWISTAKTIETKSKRIAQMINALVNKQGFSEMFRAAQKNKL